MLVDKKNCMYCHKKIEDDNVFICEDCWNEKKDQENWNDINALILMCGILSGTMKYEELTDKEIKKLQERKGNKENK